MTVERDTPYRLPLAAGGDVLLHDAPLPEPQTVRPDGSRLGDLIDGVTVRTAVTHADERGQLCEVFSIEWGIGEGAAPYVYEVVLRAGSVRGWIVHLEQADRLFLSAGTCKVVLYDAREDSPTLGLINEFHLGDHRRGLVHIPPGVVHAVKNVGSGDARFINVPTRPYRHEAPDKHRLPRDTRAIPYEL